MPALRGKTVSTLFEPSTRTRTSFELAKRLSADVINFSFQQRRQGRETLLIPPGTSKPCRRISSSFDISAGAAETLARGVKSSVINAGDGWHEHPTQALLDLYTIRSRGMDSTDCAWRSWDVAHSRVARLNIFALTKLGAEVRVVGPPTMIPLHISQLASGVSQPRRRVARRACDQMLRLTGTAGPSPVSDHSRVCAQYGLTGDRVKLETRRDRHAPWSHQSGVEIAPTWRTACRPLFDQVANGVAVRMGILYLMSGAGCDETMPASATSTGILFFRYELNDETLIGGHVIDPDA